MKWNITYMKWNIMYEMEYHVSGIYGVNSQGGGTYTLWGIQNLYIGLTVRYSQSQRRQRERERDGGHRA